MQLRRRTEIFWLPVILTFLFVLESLLFNIWLKIGPVFYFETAIAASLGLSMLLFFPSAFFDKRNARYLYLLIISILVALIFISQFIYYEYSGGFLEASSLGYAKQTIDLIGTIKTLLSYKLLLFIAPILLIIGGYFWSGRKQSDKLFLKEKFIVFFLMLIIFVGGYGTLLILEKQYDGDIGRLYNNSEMYNLSSLVDKVGIVNFYLESLIQYAVGPGVATADDQSFLTNWAEDRTLPASGSDFGIYKGKNLIFIQVESVENWVIGYKINGVEVAPNLTALSEEGRYFTNYYSQIGVGNTADAEFSTLNSLYPLPDSVAFITHANNQSDALPRLLDNNKYTTAVMHGDVATFWNRSNAYPPLGYEEQFSQPDYTIPRPVGFENLGDADFFEQSLPKLEALPQPFMATLITLSTHTPFTLPPDLETLSIPKGTDLTPTQQQYLQAVHYSDQALGNFIAGLKADGLYNKSLILIFGDHAAFIGTPDSQTQHVPLIMLGSGNFLEGTDTIPASHLDVYPTVADLLGIHYPISVLGQDIFNTKTPAVTERVPGTGAIKFIISSDFKYTGSADGIFKDGNCLGEPGLTAVPIDSCKTLYDKEASTTEASDVVVRYNLLPLLTPQK